MCCSSLVPLGNVRYYTRVWHRIICRSCPSRISLIATIFIRHSVNGYLGVYWDIEYNGEPANAPANGNWNLSIVYLGYNETEFNYLNIAFLPTGSVDKEKTEDIDLALANSLLNSTISLLGFNGNTDEFWRLLNWVVVSHYWIFLGSLGQVVPTTYVPTENWVYPDFSQPTAYPSTYNIFVNNTLFQIYSAYLRETIMPLLGFALASPFQPLSETNHLNPSMSTFLRSYTCQFPKLKGGWIFSVFAVDFAFISGAYKLAMFLAERWEKRNETGNIYILGTLLIGRKILRGLSQTSGLPPSTRTRSRWRIGGLRLKILELLPIILLSPLNWISWQKGYY
jgi:hypothetical protein